MGENKAAMFISFEGSEGCGKTTQVALLTDFLKSRGYDVLTTREPGGTHIGDQIRDVLLKRENVDMQARTEILLFQASRAQLVQQVIVPHLENGGVVICDRYADSTVAYQGYGYGVDLDQLKAIIHFATNGLKPDLTFLMDVDIRQGLLRRTEDGDINRLDAYDLDFYERVWGGYLQMAQAEPERWMIVDANRKPEQIQEEIQEIIGTRLNA
jgi:dTMP kinase